MQISFGICPFYKSILQYISYLFGVLVPLARTGSRRGSDSWGLAADRAVGEATTGVSTVGEEVLSRFGVLGWLVNARAGVRGAAALEVAVGKVLVLSEIGGHFGGRAKSAGEGWVCPLLGVWARLLARADG